MTTKITKRQNQFRLLTQKKCLCFDCEARMISTFSCLSRLVFVPNYFFAVTVADHGQTRWIYIRTQHEIFMNYFKIFQQPTRRVFNSMECEGITLQASLGHIESTPIFPSKKIFQTLFFHRRPFVYEPSSWRFSTFIGS
jgi:hypothetical protein